MPYIITTINPQGAAEQDSDGRSYYVPTSTRTAVATLNEADLYLQRFDQWQTVDVRNLPESGGTVGPLPDGTVVEVHQVDNARLAELAGTTSRLQSGQAKLTSLIVAAFNAR